uniref:Retrotransposon protein, putative, Ty1-copia subclass n=1 Tax=Tanacetum cinerariifolium TaxID=118510 RepID=A0A6L2LEN9_TANCI|nr:hypothetical protein [Tanacetum cinerariifolium]
MHGMEKTEDPAKDSVCHHCGDTGHWKRKCPQYLCELLKNKKLPKGASTSVSMNNLVYFSVVPRDGIYEIDLSNYNTNDHSMYVVSNKRAKSNLDSSLLWHCHLGNISKKRIEKLQQDGLLNSIDTKSFEKCVSCLSGKMARKPYSHQVKRAKDLLGLIHTNVCGPFRIVSRQGASYFVTFTNDFSLYSYVYLLKHKHEVFKTFKVFQKKLETQFGKTIKLLCSDCGSEYMSHEFLDHLKEHGIIAHRTPPYTPQHNGVSEKRNRTLLDMVCSMMSQTTLLKSFCDYALESVACILNMVPTKKVEKTPYAVTDMYSFKMEVRKIIYGLGVVPTIKEPIKMYCDNIGAITIANESGITKCVRDYRAKVYYLREVIKFSDVKIEKVHTDDNLADPFTKALAFPKHSEHTKNIRMLPASISSFNNIWSVARRFYADLGDRVSKVLSSFFYET